MIVALPYNQRKVSENSNRSRRSKSTKRVKSKQMALWVEPELAKAFDEYCDRTRTTKSDILRECIGFLIEHPELGSGREALEKMLAVYKASSLGESENVS